MLLSFVALLLLTAFAAIAAIAISLRARLAGRAELLVASTVVWNVLILIPIYGLGWTRQLTALNLTGASTVVSLLSLAFAARGRPTKMLARELCGAVRGLVRLPVDGLLLAARPASLVLLAVFGSLVLILWSFVSAYLAHPLRMWDCFWYHEPIVAFAIQYHGFTVISLPESLERINSLPKAGEMTALWFVILTDRRLIDITNSLLSPALIATQYLLCVRFAKSRVIALGWACAFFLMPTILWELGSTLVDDHMAFALLAALAFAASPRFELEHAMLAALALTLAVGIKYQTLVPSFIVALIVLVRIWLPQGFRGSPAGSRHRTPVATKAGVTLLGAGSILGFGATTYLRNYWVFKNPFWPFLIPSHKEWPGYLEKGQDLTKAGVDINIPYEEAFRSLFISQYANLNYGFGFVWVILPLFALASVVYLWSVLGCVARWGRARRGVHGTDWSALLLVFSTCLPAIAVVWTSPSLNQARYHDFVVGVMLALIAWMTGASRLGGLAGEGAIGAVTVISMMGYLDASPRFLLSPHELRALAAVPYPEREVDHDLGSIVFKDVGLAREHELGPGDIVAFGKNYGGFPSEFFNNRMSNRAIYLPDESTFLDDADAMGAKWIYCQSGSSCAYAAQQHGWAPIGELHSMQAGKVYHRIQSRN